MVEKQDKILHPERGTGNFLFDTTFGRARWSTKLPPTRVNQPEQVADITYLSVPKESIRSELFPIARTWPLRDAQAQEQLYFNLVNQLI